MIILVVFIKCANVVINIIRPRFFTEKFLILRFVIKIIVSSIIGASIYITFKAKGTEENFFRYE